MLKLCKILCLNTNMLNILNILKLNLKKKSMSYNNINN